MRKKLLQTHLSMLCAMLLFAAPLMAQSITVNGTVRDNDGRAIVGATIAAGTVGTISDATGGFSIQVPAGGQLTVSYLGYATQTIPVNSRTTIDIVMQEDVTVMSDVVVVGYGTQKKINLTGAVGTVTASELTKRTAPNTSSLLQGRMPGMQITQNTAMPGNEGIEIRVRGMGTFSSAGNNPLILIDGVEGDLNMVNPNMIENISVLKDASSAAIYGSRAANGVILVTTKQGSETNRISVDYSFNYSVQSPTEPMERITNSVEYMELVNKAIDFSVNQQTGWRYTDAEIQRYRDGQNPSHATYNPAQFPNADWLDYLLRNGVMQQHFASINGGNSHTSFNAGLGYMRQEGIMLGTEYERYDAQINFKSNLNSRVTFGTNINMNYGVRKDTSWTSMGNMDASRDQMRSAYAASPLFTPQLPDGSGRWAARAYENKGGNKNPIAVATDGGGQLEDENYILASSFLGIDIIEGLNAQIKGAVKFNEAQNKMMVATYPSAVFLPDADGTYTDLPSTSAQSFTQQNSRSKQYTLFGTLNYNKTFADKHNLSAMAGYSQENYKYESINGYRTNYTITDMWYLSMGPTPAQTNGSSVNEWALMSVFGRVNYDYMGKYLFEANVRHDGTSRLPKSGRWGTFPSVSLGWRLSEESFIKDNVSAIRELKLRGSVGQLGNQNIGNYPYQSILSLTNYNFGGNMSQGYYSNAMVNNDIKWETTTSTNIGLDFTLWNGMLSGSVDWYNKRTTDILRGLQVPNFVGISGPTVNQGEMKNVGWDISLSHENRVGGLRYGIKFNLDTYKNTLVKYGADEISGAGIRREGLPWGTFYVLLQDGVYQNEAEVAAGPKTSYAGGYVVKPGDIRFKDVSGPDGVPDGQVDVTYDRTTVGGVFPKFNYSFNVSLEWKWFDLNMFFQGVHGRKIYVNAWGVDPFNQASAPPTFWRNAWDGEGTSDFLPHIFISGHGGMPGNSDFWLRDASYLRLKNLQLGFTFPQKWTQKVLIPNVRLYFSGDNLLTFTKFFDGYLDPERTSQGTSDAIYPQARIYTFGLKVTF